MLIFVSPRPIILARIAGVLKARSSILVRIIYNHISYYCVRKIGAIERRHRSVFTTVFDILKSQFLNLLIAANSSLTHSAFKTAYFLTFSTR